MKNLRKILLLLLFATTIGKAQNPAFCLPPKYYQDGVIKSLPQSADGYSITVTYDGNAKYASNMYTDADGEILFFVIDNRIFDKDGVIIDELYRDSDSPKGWGEIIISAVPGDCRKYYIFLAGENAYHNLSVEPYFAILDLEATNIYYPSRKGALLMMDSNGNTAANLADVIPSNVEGFFWDLSLTLHGNVSMALSQKRPDNSKFLFLTDGNNIYRFKVTSTGVTYDNYFYSMNGLVTRTGRNEMELVINPSNGNYRIAVNALIENKEKLFFAEIDYNTGNIIPATVNSITNNYVLLESKPVIHGVEFSASTDWIYFTHEINTANPNAIEYVNFTNLTRGFINSAAANNYKYSQIELGLDGNLYLANSAGLAQINNHNNPAIATLVPSFAALSYNLTTPLGLTAFSTFTLPDQNDQEDYNSHFLSNIVCCNFYSQFNIEKEFYFPVGTYTVNVGSPINGTDVNGVSLGAPVVFTATTTIRSNMHIPAGANVTFNGLRLEFTPEYIPAVPNDPLDPAIPGAKLIVHQSASPTSGQGGKLTLNNCTLTVCTRCSNDRMWPGVEVWGHNIANQGSFATSPEGWMKMNAGSVIENAINGITIGKDNGTLGGGVVEGTSATVRNCQRGLLMYPSNLATLNKTKFTNCTFTVNQPLVDTDRWPFTLVRVDDGIGVQFKGCNFTNQHPSYNQGYYGVKSNNSKINIVANGGIRNKFENLSYGIFATASQQGRVINCHYSDFTTNKIGAMLGTVDYCSFTNNNFKMIDNRNDGTYFSVGLIMENSTGFTITNNDFRNNNPATGIASNPTIGIIISNSNVSQAIDNFIVKNTFTKLHFGIQNKERNFHDYVNTQALNNEGGLVMYCNSFTAPIAWADIANTGGFNPVSGIRHLQGYSQGANTAFTTNNTYSNTGLGTKDIYQDNTALFIETHWSNNVLRPEPLVVSSSVAKFYSATSLNTCSGDLLYQRVNNENVISEVNNLTNQFNDIKGDLAYGSSTQIIDMIKSNQSTGTIKNNLMNVVPYLSDEALLAYLSTNPPSGHLQQVLSACAPLSPTFLEKFNSTKQPGGIKSIVNSLPTEGISPIVLAYNNLVKINSEIDWVYADAIKTNLNDLESETAHNTALGFIKAAYKNGDCKGKLCRFEISYKDDASALANLEILRSVLIAGTPKLEIHEKLYDLYNKDIKKELETRPLLVSELETIATNTTDQESAILAIGLLNYIQDREIPMAFVGMTNGSSSKVMMQNLEEEYDNTSEISNESISNFPNPFTGKTTLTAKVPDYATSSEMVVINVLGKEVARYTLQAGENAITFDNEDAKGILYYSLYINGKRKATKMMLKQ